MFFSLFKSAHPSKKTSIHQFKCTTLSGESFDFKSLSGKKILLVNTASKCGFTRQYKELQELHLRFQNKNFCIIGFPSNDFSLQEPGTAKEIIEFCDINFKVSFLLMEKVSIKGEHAHPIYKWLQLKELNGFKDIPCKWNFHKYLINEKGELMDDVLPFRKPDCGKIINWINS